MGADGGTKAHVAVGVRVRLAIADARGYSSPALELSAAMTHVFAAMNARNALAACALLRGLLRLPGRPAH